MPVEFSEWEQDTRKPLSGLTEEQFAQQSKDIALAYEIRAWAEAPKIIYHLDNWCVHCSRRHPAHDAGFFGCEKPEYAWDLYVSFMDTPYQTYLGTWHKKEQPSEEFCREQLNLWFENNE